MKQPPAGWPRISSALFYQNPALAIDWLCDVFGFELRLKVEGEGCDILHSELTYGDGVVMVGGEQGHEGSPYRVWPKSPASIDGHNTQSLMSAIGRYKRPLRGALL